MSTVAIGFLVFCGIVLCSPTLQKILGAIVMVIIFLLLIDMAGAAERGGSRSGPSYHSQTTAPYTGPAARSSPYHSQTTPRYTGPSTSPYRSETTPPYTGPRHWAPSDVGILPALIPFVHPYRGSSTGETIFVPSAPDRYYRDEDVDILIRAPAVKIVPWDDATKLPPIEAPSIMMEE